MTTNTVQNTKSEVKEFYKQIIRKTNATVLAATLAGVSMAGCYNYDNKLNVNVTKPTNEFVAQEGIPLSGLGDIGAAESGIITVRKTSADPTCYSDIKINFLTATSPVGELHLSGQEWANINNELNKAQTTCKDYTFDKK